jgi:hypothetical protein
MSMWVTWLRTDTNGRSSLELLLRSRRLQDSSKNDTFLDAISSCSFHPQVNHRLLENALSACSTSVQGGMLERYA